MLEEGSKWGGRRRYLMWTPNKEYANETTQGTRTEEQLFSGWDHRHSWISGDKLAKFRDEERASAQWIAKRRAAKKRKLFTLTPTPISSLVFLDRRMMTRREMTTGKKVMVRKSLKDLMCSSARNKIRLGWLNSGKTCCPPWCCDGESGDQYQASFPLFRDLLSNYCRVK